MSSFVGGLVAVRHAFGPRRYSHNTLFMNSLLHWVLETYRARDDGDWDLSRNIHTGPETMGTSILGSFGCFKDATWEASRQPSVFMLTRRAAVFAAMRPTLLFNPE